MLDYWSLSIFSASLCLISSKFLSLSSMNFYLSISFSYSNSLFHWSFSIPLSWSTSLLWYYLFMSLVFFCQSSIVIVSPTSFFFSIASCFSLSSFFMRSSFHNYAYICSSSISCIVFFYLSRSCFSLSNWQFMTWNLASSFLSSSVAINNKLKISIKYFLWIFNQVSSELHPVFPVLFFLWVPGVFEPFSLWLIQEFQDLPWTPAHTFYPLLPITLPIYIPLINLKLCFYLALLSSKLDSCLLFRSATLFLTYARLFRSEFKFYHVVLYDLVGFLFPLGFV